MAPAWVENAVFYQIIPDRYCRGSQPKPGEDLAPWGSSPTGRAVYGGDLAGIRKKLEYLEGLGITALYLTPIFAAQSSHKYDTQDYLSVDPLFGDAASFAWLVKCCHARGIRVILDAVFNHSGTKFFAFKDVRTNGEQSRFRDWYSFRAFPVGPPSKPNYECWWGIGSLPKLNTANPEVRDYLFGVTRHWMQFGIDGWRLDVPNEVPQEFWRDWRRLVKGINSDAYIVGEIWDDAAQWLHGDLFDGVMNYPLRTACIDFFVRRSASASEFGLTLAAQRSRYPRGTEYGLLNLLGSHDTERILTLCNNDTRPLKQLFLFLMTYPGAPMVYYGDEVGITGGKDPDCRRTMVWEARNQDRSLTAWVRDAIHLRRTYPVLRQGTIETILSDDTRGVLMFRRRDDEHEGIVVLHNTGRRVSLDLPPVLTNGDHWLQVWPQPYDGAPEACPHRPTAGSRVTLGPHEARVYISRRTA